MKKYITKDSGKRVKFASGFNRDTNEGKPRFDLIPYELLTRVAELYTRGAVKYDENNWRKAETEQEINRFKESAWRHFIAWSAGQEDEDHLSGTVFNLFSHDWHTKHKTKEDKVRD